MSMCTIMMAMTIAGTTMLEDFFARALIAGVGLALVTGPLGCFIVWRRMSYFGDTMAHSALLGVALSLMLSVNITLGVFLVAAAVAGILLVLQRRATLSTDALLGILSHSALAIGLVVAFVSGIRIDLMGFLFGDILAVSVTDIGIIYVGGTVILAVIALLWRPFLAATVNAELAEAEGMRPEVTRIVFMLLLASVIAIALKIVGVLLITAMLIIPPATARRLASSPEQMAVIAAIAGVTSIVGGLYASLHFDTPSGPSIVVAALALFIVAAVLPVQLWRQKRKARPDGA
jgi:zinc transport system permease protein